jgi:predicted MFS family arabinose efflux permease
MAVLSLLGKLDIATLLGVAFAVGTLSVFFDVAYQAGVVRLVDRDLLVRATSALEGSRSAAQTVGPAFGGVLVSLFRAAAGAGLCAVFFAASFVSIRGMHRPEPIPHRSSRGPRVGRQIREGLRFVLADPLLRALALASAAFQFSFAALMTVYLLFLPRDLHVSGAAVGLALAATGPGAVLGSLLAARLPKRFGYGVVLVAAPAIAEGVLLFVPTLHGPTTITVAVLLAVNFVFGLCSQIVDVTAVAVRQSVTADDMQGRASATITFIGMGLTPLGSLLGGCLAEQWGLRATLLAATIGALLSPALIALSPLARLGRTLPPQDTSS